MIMDQLFIDAVVSELQQTLGGAAVSKVHQPTPMEIVLRLWTGRDNVRLLLSIDPQASRLHLTRSSRPNPQNPPRFCQLLRSRLARLLSIERLSGERLVKLSFAGGRDERWTLLAELRGANSNLFLLDAEDRIVDVLRRGQGEGRGRQPGGRYQPPPTRGLIDLADGLPEIPQEGSFRNWLLQAVTPMTPLFAADLEAGLETGMTPEELLEDFRRRWLQREFRPVLASWGKSPVLLPFYPRFVELDQVCVFTSPSEAADAFYSGSPLAAGSAPASGKTLLERTVRKASQRLQRRLEKIEAEMAIARNCERQRELGELLLANLFRLRRGMDQVAVEDYYAEPVQTVVIPLEPRLAPQQNAEAYFRRYRKGKRGLVHMEQRRSATIDELEWLGHIALAIEEAESANDLDPLREELEASGLLSPPPGARKPAAADAAAAGPRQGTTPGGYTIIWGRNNRSNDKVSHKLARPGDLWFHAHGIPGCHLLLKGGSQAPEEDVLYAAAVAAGYSRGRDDAKVEVMVADPKQISRPKGARPGMVTVGHYRTVMVRPLRPEGITIDRSLP